MSRKPTDPDTSGVHLWLVMMKAHRALVQKATQSIEGTGMCFSDFAILEALLHKGPQPVNTLANWVGLTSGSGTTAIDRLESRALVQRHSDPDDKRARIVHLTPTGRTTISEAFGRHAKDMETAATVLSEAERATLLDLLRKYGKQDSIEHESLQSLPNNE